AFEAVARERHAQIRIRLLGLPSHLAEELLHAARVVLGPAVVVEPVAGDEVVPALVLAAELALERLASERAAISLQRTARILAAALGVDGERAAKRIEAEGGCCTRQELHAGDGGAGNEVPVHDVTEGLVHAHAVLENRQPLRQAQERRGGEATEAYVR